jgi:hypothetical protein
VTQLGPRISLRLCSLKKGVINGADEVAEANCKRRLTIAPTGTLKEMRGWMLFYMARRQIENTEDWLRLKAKDSFVGVGAWNAEGR